MNDLMVTAPAELESEVPEIVKAAHALVVVYPGDFQIAGDFLKRVSSAEHLGEAFFEPLVKSTDAAHKAACAARKRIMGPLAEAKKAVNTKMMHFLDSERRKAEEERRRLQAVVDEHARKEREALEAKAAKAKKPETQQKHLEAAAAVVAPVVQVPSAAPVVEGFSTVKTWKHRVLDPLDVPRRFLMVDEKKLAQYARTMKEGAEVPGVEFYCEESARLRSAQ